MSAQDLRGVAEKMGLSSAEFDKICTALERTPSLTEVAMLSAMWSEHCSYKSSRVHLKQFPTEAPWVVHGPGENAGVIDIGDNQVAVFKMESHNHPSYIEPVQGAATGVGGICRDVFTMGARPIALADCLRFGDPTSAKMKHLIDGVVRGISGYGNSFGVPTVTGDVQFDPSYQGNILVNAFCLGIADKDGIFLAKAEGVGNPVMYVGAKTGRDGIHGASMASAEFDEDSANNRPAVQVGDPFMEKLLLEACLELMKTDVLVAIQDMGAAGLTSSACEMASRGGLGVEMWLEKVPMRESKMTPFEIMLSESQERMLMVVKQGREQEAMAVFEKWDLDAAVIGAVTDSGRVCIKMNGETFADVPAELFTDGVIYDRPRKRPAYLDATEAFRSTALPSLDSTAAIEKALFTLMESPNIASKSWVFDQYDSRVRHGTVIMPGTAGAALVRVLVPGADPKAPQKGVAISAGCQSRYVYLAPYEGAKLVVAETYANLSAIGATPLAITDCLNFGNPQKPEIMWQFAEAVRGLSDACRELGTPVVSGNVSLYNETEGVGIKPTPMIAMVGVVKDITRHVTSGFSQPDHGSGHIIGVIGNIAGELGGSEYLATVCGEVAGIPAGFIANQHKPIMDAVRNLVISGLLTSAQDISEGGLLATLAECTINGSANSSNPVGAMIQLSKPRTARLDELLFGEGPARFVVSYPESAEAKIQAALAVQKVGLLRIGQTGGNSLRVVLEGLFTCDFSLAELRSRFLGGFRRNVQS